MWRAGRERPDIGQDGITEFLEGNWPQLVATKVRPEVAGTASVRTPLWQT